MIEQEQPIQPELEQIMKDIGRTIGRALQDHAGAGYGFALFMFGLAGDEKGRMNYMCNCRREDMLVALKEFIARAEGRYEGDFTKKRPV